MHILLLQLSNVIVMGNSFPIMLVLYLKGTEREGESFQLPWVSLDSGCAVVGRQKGYSAQEGMMVPCQACQMLGAEKVNLNCWDCMPVGIYLPSAAQENVFA